jgi:hypothetical protein
MGRDSVVLLHFSHVGLLHFSHAHGKVLTARSELITLFREFVADDNPDLKLRFWRHVVAGAARCEHRLSSRARRTTASIFAATLVSCPQLFRRIAARAFHGDRV